MTKKEFYAKLKYKNVAFGLACSLLLILAVGSAVRKQSEKTDKPAKAESSSAEQKEEPESQEAAQNTYTQGRGATDFKYIEVRNETALHQGLLMPYAGDEDYLGGRPEGLESVYEHLFDDKGNQLAYTRSIYVYLTGETLEHFNALITDFKLQKNHNDLMIADGYVPETLDMKDNEYWTEDYTKALKCDEHYLGTSIDLKVYKGDGSYPDLTNEGDYAWVYENLPAYGFILRYPEGKQDITGNDGYSNHIRFVGYPDSQIMYDKKLTLEEYIDELKKYDYKNELILTDTHGGRYCVYYVPADEKGRTTNIPVPIKADGELKYRISGDGDSGFVVSCMLDKP